MRKIKPAAGFCKKGRCGSSVSYYPNNSWVGHILSQVTIDQSGNWVRQDQGHLESHERTRLCNL